MARLRKDVDDATMVRVDLERKIETLREELEYNRKIHSDVRMIKFDICFHCVLILTHRKSKTLRNKLPTKELT